MKKSKIKILIAVVVAIVSIMFNACTFAAGGGSSSSTQTEPTLPPKSAEEIMLESMTIEQKAAQTIVTGLSETQVDDEFVSLAERGVGGTILFGKNITDAPQLVKLTNQIKSCAGKIPILIGMDEEGGRVTRLPNDVLSMPSAYSIASKCDPGYCNLAGQNIGNQVKSFGLSTGFAPVLDIWSNEKNTVIGNRAFGKTADEVIKYGIEYLKGMMSTGTIAIGKHFPGHGDTEIDSHHGLPIVNKTKEELYKMELIPFKKAIENGIPGIMVAHILYPKIDQNGPSTISKTIVTDILKSELNFDGVVFTDDLTMGAISKTYTVDQAAIKALNAGCDMLLVCFEYSNANKTIDAIVDAVKSGKLSEKRLDDAVLRILRMKNTYNLDSKPISLPDIDATNEKTRHFKS